MSSTTSSSNVVETTNQHNSFQTIDIELNNNSNNNNNNYIPDADNDNNSLLPSSSNDLNNHQPNTILDLKAHNGIRGIASIWVAIFHCMFYTTGFNISGNAPMPIFFILSGFTLTVVYIKQARGQNHTGSNYVAFDNKNSNDSNNNNNTTSENDIVNNNNVENGNSSTNNNNNNTKNIILINKINWFTFMKKRFARIGPLYLLTNFMMMFGYIIINNLNTGQWISYLIGSYLCIGSWSLDLGKGHGWFSTPVWLFNPVAWTVSSLFFCYILFPYLLTCFANNTMFKNRRVYIINCFSHGWTFCYVFFIIIGHFGFAYFTPWVRILQFMCGINIGLLCVHDDANGSSASAHEYLRNYKRPNLYALYGLAIYILISAILSVLKGNFLGIIFNSLGSEVYTQYIIIDYIIYFAIVKNNNNNNDHHQEDMMTDNNNQNNQLISNHEKVMIKLKEFLSSSRIQFFGKISLALYLIHFLLLGIVLRVFFQLDRPFEPPAKGNFLHLIGSILIVLPGSICLGWVLTTYVEEPARKWLRK